MPTSFVKWRMMGKHHTEAFAENVQESKSPRCNGASPWHLPLLCNSEPSSEVERASPEAEKKFVRSKNVLTPFPHRYCRGVAHPPRRSKENAFSGARI